MVYIEDLCISCNQKLISISIGKVDGNLLASHLWSYDYVNNICCSPDISLHLNCNTKVIHRLEVMPYLPWETISAFTTLFNLIYEYVRRSLAH